MICAEVRSLLVERSVGTLASKEVAGVDRHVAWCAACRKEVGEFDAAAASLVYALVRQEPPPELEDQVVAVVRSAVTAGVPAAHRRGRMVVAATVAAMIAVAGLGFGAVMAGRAARFRDQAITSKVANRKAEATFQQILLTLEFPDPRNRVEMADLASVGGESASGIAWTLLAPGSQDLAMVTISALRVDPPRLPLEVALVGPHRKITVGSISKLDSGGGATVATQLDSDLSYFDQVVIRDAKGIALLRGGLAAHPFQSPTPSP